MAERRRGRNIKDSEKQELSKEEKKFAKHVRFNCPTKNATFEGKEVEYFTGSKAIDTLYESKWGTKASGEKVFPTRHSAYLFLKKMMECGLFFRVRKLVPKKKVSMDKAGDNGKEEEDEDKKKTQKKVKLLEHSDQYFTDSKDVYVWVFDPPSLYTLIMGALILVGCVLGCLFKFWPSKLQLGVYYTSMLGLSVIGALFAVAFARTILFGVIWLMSMGRHKLWILPNLTEDCGFFESFKPLYTYEYCPGPSEKTEDTNNN
uniref:Translocation protein SEC62 n=1 Tax=Steinernema glaseri TaxID=37863 RepID=A0A1I7YYC5_9BILA